MFVLSGKKKKGERGQVREERGEEGTREKINTKRDQRGCGRQKEERQGDGGGMGRQDEGNARANQGSEEAGGKYRFSLH